MGLQQLQNLKIVVVDDQEEVRSAIDHYLSSLGAQVHTYENANQLLDALLMVQPDLVICAIHMPEEAGVELLHQIRSLEQGVRREVPVIAMTTFANEIERIKALQPGFSGFLRKPFTPDALLRIISDSVKL
jgi:CheY-like chemotaxis protein